MATILDKTITRDSGNIINTNTNYSELNTKASGLVNDIVSHVETQIQTTETALQASENLVDAKIASLLSVGDTGYTKDVVDTNFANQINALAPYSGYTSVSKKLDNFVFKEDANFTYSVADKNRFVKFGDKVVDTYGDELVTNGDFSDGTTGWVLEDNDPVIYISNGKVVLGNQSIIRQQNIPVEAGKIYYIKYFVSNNDNRFVTYFRDQNGSVLQDNSWQGRDGLFEHIYTIPAGVTSMQLRILSQSVAVEFDNISVKEIQTAQFEVPEVAEVITDGSNTTSVAVSQGDYVVDGSELVTGKTQSINGGTLTTNTDVYFSHTLTANDQFAYKTMTLTPNKTYKITFNALQRNSNYSDLLIGSTVTGGEFKNVSNSFPLGVQTYTFIPTTSTVYITWRGGLSGNTTEIDNISVKRVSDTFRAIQDAPIGTALTNTTYFQDRTEIGVTNQQLSYHAYNTVTNAYEGIKTEVLFSDVSKEDLLDNSAWMSANGFSKVSDFLYSKGSYLVLPVGIWQSLNKGAYHPVFNAFGTRGVLSKDLDNISTRIWFAQDGAVFLSGIDVLNTSDTFQIDATDTRGLGSIILGGSGYGNIAFESATASYKLIRPDSKFYDIVYSDQFIDVREYAKILTRDEVAMIVADKEDNGVEETVSMIQYQANGSGSGNGTYWVSNLGTAPDINNTLIEGETFIFTVVSTDDPFISAGTYQYPLSYNATLDAYYINTGGGVLTSSYNTVILTTTTKPVLSSSTKLSIDLIGDPANYPQIMKDRLASGVGIVGINPLLVNQDGTSAIPSGSSQTVTMANKVVVANIGNHIYSTDGGDTYAPGSLTGILGVTNSQTTTFNATHLGFVNYTSKNQPYIQTTPKPVIDVEPKVIASNSHSIYKGALIGNQVAGKVQVGNGTNGYESKVLENDSIFDMNVTRAEGTFDLLQNSYVLRTSDCTAGLLNHIYYYTGTSAYDVSASVLSFNTTYYFDKGVYTTPTHSTIALDNANSPASKWFETLEEGNNGVLAGVYGTEMIWDFDLDDAYNEFTSILESALLNTLTVGTLYKITNGNAYGVYTCVNNTLHSSYSVYGNNYRLLDTEGNITDSSGVVILKRWDGNGFGDDDTFEQLTNGTITDLNGNTARTFHGSIALNGKVK